MKYISLLPSEYRQTVEAGRKNRRNILIGGIIVAALVFIYLILLIAAIFPANKLKSIKMQNESMKKQVSVLREFEALDSNASNLEQLKAKALGETTEWGELIADIGTATPHDLWLVEITINKKDGGTQVVIKGLTLQHTSVALFTEKIRAIPGLGHLKYKTSNITKNKGTDAIQFEISSSGKEEKAEKPKGKEVAPDAK